jgi:hypothetical protein
MLSSEAIDLACGCPGRGQGSVAVRLDRGKQSHAEPNNAARITSPSLAAGKISRRNRRDWCILRTDLIGWQRGRRHNARFASNGARLDVTNRCRGSAARRPCHDSPLDQGRSPACQTDAPRRAVSTGPRRCRSLRGRAAAGSGPSKSFEGESSPDRSWLTIRHRAASPDIRKNTRALKSLAGNRSAAGVWKGLLLLILQRPGRALPRAARPGVLPYTGARASW